jgi:enhancer of mRNA-decapping protein 3
MERTDSARTARERERDQWALNDITPAATLMESSVSPVEIGVKGLILEELEAEADAGVKEDVPPVKKTRTRRHRQRKKDGVMKEGEVTPAKETTKSKGWRQTPLLEPNPSFQPFATLKKKGRRDGRVDENGWATEDATDVQDMGDFDFAGSLAKFDKHEVFNQIQAEDSVADEDRLVAHNRLPKVKPGTAGGKNLHCTENVLDVPNGAVKTRGELWKNEAGDSDLEERASQRGSGSGRLSRRARKAERSESKLSMNRRPISRKGSSIINIPPARTLSVSHPSCPC